MNSTTQQLPIFLFSTAVLAAVFGCSSHTSLPQLEVGLPAPSLELATATGGDTLTIESLKGEIVVLNFWSTSCAVCLQELGDLKEIHESGKAKVVGIALDEDGQRVRNVIDKRSIDYPVLLGDQETFERFDGFSIPYTLIIDRSQVVRKRFFGRMTEEDLDQVLLAIEAPQRVAMHSLQARSASE